LFVFSLFFPLFLKILEKKEKRRSYGALDVTASVRWTSSCAWDIAQPFGGFIRAMYHVVHTEGLLGLFRGTRVEVTVTAEVS